ncbi:WD repeat protein [Cryptosporidium ryanae]|uniref:WD repeat protein n=1 Tax=Cryptosporidium ryanae TaxID=515981 RepID=UPI00351A3BF5|nr:WD repeat protein [Cryptosporidium ryanae]
MLLSCGIIPDVGISDEITLVCCSSWNSICATGTKSGHVYLWQISSKGDEERNNLFQDGMTPLCVLIPNSVSLNKLLGMVFILSPSPLLQSCTDELLLTLHSDNVLRYWSLDNGRCIAQLADSADHEVLQLVSLSDKRFVLLVGHQRITIIDTWSRLNCGVLKIASCPLSKRMVNNRIDEDTPEMYKIQSPNSGNKSLDSKDDKANKTLQSSNVYGEYGESMIFNVSTNHDYFDLLKWSSNISLFDYCDENKYPTAHFYTVAAMLNTGQVLVWDLSSLIRIWWYFIPIPHCEIPCPVPKPKLSSVPKPFMKYCQDHFVQSKSSFESKDQCSTDKTINITENGYSNMKITGSSEELIGAYDDYEFVFEYQNNNENSKLISHENPNIYQLQSNKSPILAPTLFSLHPCFVSEPINLYSIPSNEMFSTQIIVTDLYLIVNGKYRLIIWKRTFLPHLQNRNQRYQPFGDLFVPNTPLIDNYNFKVNNSVFYISEASHLKRTMSCNIEDSDTGSKRRPHIWLGFSQTSLEIGHFELFKAKTLSSIKLDTNSHNEFQTVSFLAWCSDLTIYNIKIPSVVSFMFSQDYNPNLESKIASIVHENSEIDYFGDYNDINAIPVFISRDYSQNIPRHKLNYMGHLSSCWQFFRINTLNDQAGNKLGSPFSLDDCQFNLYSNNVIWIHRNNFKLIEENTNEIFADSFENHNADKIFYAFLNSDLFSKNKQNIPVIYNFPLLPNVSCSIETSKSFNNSHSYKLNNIEIYDSMNVFYPVETESDSHLKTKEDEDLLSSKKNNFWKSTCALKLVWENYLNNFNRNSDFSVIACHITEQKGSIYCIMSLSNGKVVGQCLTGEFGLFNFVNCNEDKHFFGNIENGVVYQLPTPKISRDHTILVTELKSVTDGCIFGLTCCGCVLVWKVDLIENFINDFVNNSYNSCMNMGSHSNLNPKISSKLTRSIKKTHITSNNLFSLIACIEGLFFTNIISLSNIIVFDINRLGELETPRYDKFQILIHSYLEKKCTILGIKDSINGKEAVNKTNKRQLGCIWDEKSDFIHTECQGVLYEAITLSLHSNVRHDVSNSRITSVAIDNPSNYIYIIQSESVFIFDKDSCTLLTIISLNSVLNMKDIEYQNRHLSFGLMSNLNRFVQTSSKIEFLDHGIMYGSLFLGYIPKRNNSSTCLNVHSTVNLSYITFNPHVSTDVVSIEKKKQRNTKTYKYLQHLFPLFIKSANEFLSTLFVSMTPLSVRPIMKFGSIIIGVNYSISIPIPTYNTNQRQALSNSKLWDSVDSYLNISKIGDPRKTKRSESVDRFRSIYKTSKESKIRSYTFDGVGLPPYRYVVSENWSQGLLEHLDIKTMSIKTLRSKLTMQNIDINNYNGKPFSEWKKNNNKRRQLGVETNDYYIGELSGIPCTSHLVNQIVRSRHSISNKMGNSNTRSPESHDNCSIVSRTLSRGETFDGRMTFLRVSTCLGKNEPNENDNYGLEERCDTPRQLFRSRTYESTVKVNKECNFDGDFEFNIDETDQVWLGRFLSERNINSNNPLLDKGDSCSVYDLNNNIVCTSGIYSAMNSPEYFGLSNSEYLSPHHLALQMVFLHYYITYYSNLDLPIQLLDKLLLSWIINQVGQERLMTRFIPSYLLSITSMTLDIFNPYIRSSAKYCLQLAIRSFPTEFLSYCEEITIDTLSGILMEFSYISSRDSQSEVQTGLLEKEVLNSVKSDKQTFFEDSIGNRIKSRDEAKIIPPWNESCKRGHPKNYSYCCISLCRMIGYRLPFPVMNSGEYYRSNLSIEDLSLFFLSMVLYEHPFKRTHSKCIGKITLAFLISIIVSYDIEVITKFSKNFDKKHLEKKRLLKPIYARKKQNEQWYSWENLHIDINRSSIIMNSHFKNNKNNLNYDFSSYYNVISIMDTLRFLFAIDLFSLNFASLLKSKYIEDTLIPDLLKNSLTNWENNIFNATKLFQIEGNMTSEETTTIKNNIKVHSKVSNSIICLCIRLLTLAQYPPFWTSCRHLLQLIGQLDPSTYIFILGYSGKTAYLFMGINYTCNILSLLVYFISGHPEYSFPHLNMVIEITIGFLDPLDSTLRKGTITAITSVLFILVSVFPTITFHQNTQRLAIGYENSIIVYDLRTATKWRVLQGHKGEVDALCFNKEGEYLASYSISERSLRIWQCTQSGLLGNLLGISGSCIKTIELSEIPQRPLNISLYNRLKFVKITCKNENEWQLRRENKKTYSITIERS